MASDCPSADATTPDVERLHLELASRTESIATARDALAGRLAVRGIDAGRRAWIEIAVGEAVANAIEHGNGGDRRRRVTVDVRLDAGSVEVRVGDEGAGFDPGAVPDPRCGERLLHPRGRGLLLMRSAVDEVAFAAGRVVLRTAIAHHPPPQEAVHPMKITTRTSNGVTILDVDGKLLIGAGDQTLRQAVHAALDSGATKVLLNIAKVTAIDSSGIGELVSSYTMTTNRGAKLKLVNVPQKILDLLHITKLITIFEVHDTEAEALASFA